MAKTQNRLTEVDERFYVPSSVIDVRQVNKENSDYLYNPLDFAVEGPVLSSPVAVIPSVPTSYEIIEQKVRIASDGRAVVDVIVEFPDVDGIYSIDVRITKT